jgi:hypothetical protein
MENQTSTITQIQRTEKPNSYEFGKASSRFKLYFEDAKDLKTQMTALKEEGILVEEAVVL